MNQTEEQRAKARDRSGHAVRSVCIVGHGPSLKTARLGCEIDKHFVVRLKNCAMLLAEPHNYGTKTNALCTSTETLYNLTKVKAVEYWGYPKTGSYSEARVRRAERELRSKIHISLDACNLWNCFFVEMGAQHHNVSCGMGALITALDHLKPDIVWLAGFDKVLNPETPGYQCTVPTPFNNGGTQDTGHDWASEKKLFPYLCAYYKAKILCLP